MSSGPASSDPADGAPGTAEPEPGAPGPVEPGRCLVCDTPSSGAYCPGCGQRVGAGRLTFRQWLADFLDDNLSLNGTLPRSLGLLLLRPGYLTEEWLEGRRSPYTRPFRLYLIASALFFAVALTVGLEEPTQGVVAVEAGEGSWDEIFLERWGSGIPTAMFFLVPLFALFLKLFFRGAGLYYIEHLIFALHLHAAAFLILVPTWILELLPEPWLTLSQIPFLLWMLVHAVVGVRRVYGTGWLGAAGKGVGLLLLYIVVVGGATASGTAVGLLLTEERPLREAHEAYFEYMDSLEAGADSAVVRRRLAEILRSYESVDRRVFDAHDHYHMGRLELERGRPVVAWSGAAEALRRDSTALLPLGLATRAAWELGAEREARRHARAFLRVLETTIDEDGGLRGRHVPALLAYRELARRIVDQGGAGTGPSEDEGPPDPLP